MLRVAARPSGLALLDDVGHDVRHAGRGLARSPGFTVAVVIVVALGAGVTTAMFGVTYSVLIRPLPYPAGERIVRASARSLEECRERPCS